MSSSPPSRVQSLRWLALLLVIWDVPILAMAGEAQDATEGFYDPASVQTIKLEIKSVHLEQEQYFRMGVLTSAPFPPRFFGIG